MALRIESIGTAFYGTSIDRVFIRKRCESHPSFRSSSLAGCASRSAFDPGRELDNRMESIPLKPIKQLRGFAKGIDTTVERDQDRV